MNTFKKLRIGTRLAFAFGLVAVLMIAMAVTARLGLRGIRERLASLGGRLDHPAVLVPHRHQHGGRGRIQVPDIVRDLLLANRRVSAAERSWAASILAGMASTTSRVSCESL